MDLEAVLAPIPGDNPAGADLRYSSVYVDIKEARRADDLLNRGEWQTSVIKRSDWDKVITISVEALSRKTKDLQIAAWLTEALIKTEGFGGLSSGLKVINEYLTAFWNDLYPVIEEEDLEFRAAPLEFLNDKLWTAIKDIPLTDSSVTPGYSWLKWQESRQVGAESSVLNQRGDVDEEKKQRRQELIDEGKITTEDFDAAVSASSKDFYKSLANDLRTCREEFLNLDRIVDEKFGREAPRLAELGKSMEECEQLVLRILKDKGGIEPEVQETREVPGEIGTENPQEAEEGVLLHPEAVTPGIFQTSPAGSVPELLATEEAIWQDALQTMQTGGIREALGRLLESSYRAPSIRERNRYRLMTAKLCLKADRADLARPLIEELHSLIEELHLERWESPRWIGEVLDTFYQVLTRGEPSDDDLIRAKALLQRLCTLDVTLAVNYRG